MAPDNLPGHDPANPILIHRHGARWVATDQATVDSLGCHEPPDHQPNPPTRRGWAVSEPPDPPGWSAPWWPDGPHPIGVNLRTGTILFNQPIVEGFDRVRAEDRTFENETRPLR